MVEGVLMGRETGLACSQGHRCRRAQGGPHARWPTPIRSTHSAGNDHALWPRAGRRAQGRAGLAPCTSTVPCAEPDLALDSVGLGSGDLDPMLYEAKAHDPWLAQLLPPRGEGVGLHVKAPILHCLLEVGGQGKGGDQLALVHPIQEPPHSLELVLRQVIL